MKKFASAYSKNKNWREAISEISMHIKKDMDGAPIDLLVVFVSESYEDFDPGQFSNVLTHFLPAGTLIGCNSGGVIGQQKEIEMEPALSALAMNLPDVKIYPFQLNEADIASLKSGHEIIQTMDIYPTDKPHFLVFSDPMSFDMIKYLQLVNEGYKNLPVAGALASGVVMGVPNWVMLNGIAYSEGLVGVALVGDIQLDSVVSQGCRPVGKPYVITKAEGNVLLELAGKPALEVVRDLIHNLSPKDKKLAEFSLSVGLVMNERLSDFKRGDFLIRNLVGFDPDANSLMVGSMLKVGQTLQFQVRDAEASAEDLKHFLEGLSFVVDHPKGGLLFSCCGRGRNFYGKPDHDAKLVYSTLGPMPLAGFFANGEIGPVGHKNFVHGYTASLVIFR